MEFSDSFNSSLHSIPSPDGSLVATVESNLLVIRSTVTFGIVRKASVKAELAQIRFIKWSPRVSEVLPSDIDESSFLDGLKPDAQSPQKPRARFQDSPNKLGRTRILVADESTIQVWDVDDSTWTATITKAGEEVKVTNVDFGQNADEVVALSDSNLRISIWNLSSGKCIKIRDPKFTTKGHGWRPRTGHFALLARPAAQDIIMIHAPSTYMVINQNVLPNFDAQGLKWSPDGRWIAVWDAASRGFGLDIYTPDGHLYRTCNRKPEQDVNGLGIKTIEWSTSGDTLAIGDFDNKITLLSHLTFSPQSFIGHPSTIEVSDAPVWQELVHANEQRKYTRAEQSITPPLVPFSATDSSQKLGISSISFNESGSMMSVRSDTMPTTLWIWNVPVVSSAAVLVHHSAISKVLWHPTISDLLLISCADADDTMYLWKSTWEKPRIVSMPSHVKGGRIEARWIRTEPPKSISPGASPSQLIDLTSTARCPTLMAGNAHHFCFGYVQDEDFEAPPQCRAQDQANENHNQKNGPGEQQWANQEHSIGPAEVEDTFRFRRHVE